MKRILTFLAFLSVCLVNAQSFNYQAVVRDAGGNPVANQTIGVRVSLERASANIYQETHTVNSDANGLINFAVGTGVNTGFPAFSTIDWSTQDFNMIMEVDITGGTTYVNIGTTFLRQVPYAMYAASAPSTNYFSLNNNVLSNLVDSTDQNNNSDDDFIIGSYQLDQSSPYNSKMFFDVSKGSFRAGIQPGTSTRWDDANRGNYSVAFGYNTTASGAFTYASGNGSGALGNYGFAHGNAVFSLGDSTIAMGTSSTAFATNSIAIGTGLRPQSFGETYIGMYSTEIAGNSTTFVPTDRLFVVGNGTDAVNTSDALVVLKNGNTTLNGELTIDGDNQGVGTSYTLPAQDGTASQVLTTDGSGVVTWSAPVADGDADPTNEIELPTGGNNGEILSTDGAGNYSWIVNDDTDADPTNEIELPTGGTNGQILSTDGSGVYSWINQPSPATGAFSTTANITSNAPGNIATDDFVFGSTQLDDILINSDDNSRMFFDKSKSAFRAGKVTLGEWDANRVGDGSIGLGANAEASGVASLAIGDDVLSSGFNSIVIGQNSQSTGNTSISMGYANYATAPYATAIGNNLISESYAQTTLGQNNTSSIGSVSAFIPTDRLFVVGNGALPATKSDALVMLKNGNTTLNGSLTIDGDNQGVGTSYTLPAQDGTANYVMTTDGAGNVSWQAASAGGTTLPGGGNNGDQLTTDGSGNYSWTADAVNDADADPTNEIELPTGGSSGQILSTDGSGTYSWINAVSSGAFSTTANITSNAPGNTIIDNFVSTDRLFVVGNGTTSTTSDALVMLKNGNTTLNGSLTIDGDNQGVGTSYTLPAHDGTANQVITTDGSGNTVWTTVPSGTTLPTGGINGDQLTTDGSGNYSWTSDAVNDADSDPTNEIELPTGGTNGQVLKSDGAGSSVWSSDVEATSVKVTDTYAFNLAGGAIGYTTVGQKEINSWSTTGTVATTDLFNDAGTAFNTTNGRFTAPVDGLYFFSVQARVDGFDTDNSFWRLMIVKNNLPNYYNGLHALSHQKPGPFHTQHVSGILKLNAGDSVSVYIEGTGDTSYIFQIESGFNGYLVTKL